MHSDTLREHWACRLVQPQDMRAEVRGTSEDRVPCSVRFSLRNAFT
jgi:hypothetical protein